MTTLYTYFRSSAAFRVRIAMNLKGLAYDPQVIWLTKGEQVQPGYRSHNRQGLVPTLVTDDGQHLTQSMAIIEYLDETHPQPALLPADPAGRARVRALSQIVGCDIHPINNLRVLKYLKNEMGQTQPQIDAWYRHWCTLGLSALEAELAAGEGTGRFCHGDAPTMADCCLVPQIFNARRYELDLSAMPTVLRIHDACMALPAFDAAQPGKQPEAAEAG